MNDTFVGRSEPALIELEGLILRLGNSSGCRARVVRTRLYNVNKQLGLQPSIDIGLSTPTRGFMSSLPARLEQFFQLSKNRVGDVRLFTVLRTLENTPYRSSGHAVQLVECGSASASVPRGESVGWRKKVEQHTGARDRRVRRAFSGWWTAIRGALKEGFTVGSTSAVVAHSVQGPRFARVSPRPGPAGEITYKVHHVVGPGMLTNATALVALRGVGESPW
ncbi:hypothetical protein BJ322DRAFT_1024622 [Thelephora terrestris]|uniref:Uncharacterized protein n=1 Tax=Thelephora terrestris TaxID=56493 RepID=A0A9P6H602_9AGAM|nr:hypothetical protein BJ322DRAFT_1024622 [Thelephora terrestris]